MIQPVGAARGLEQQQNQGHADVEIERLGIDGAVAELGALIDDVADHGDAGGRTQPIERRDAVAPALQHREENENQRQHHADVDGPQRVGGDDGYVVERRRARRGGVEMEDRDEDRKPDDRGAEPAPHPVGGALLLLDQLLDALAFVLGELASGQHLLQGDVPLDRLGYHRPSPALTRKARACAFARSLSERPRWRHPPKDGRAAGRIVQQLARMPCSAVLYSTLMPFSAKYLSAAGCQGMPAFADFWFSTLMLSASLWTLPRSSRFSSMILVSL